MDRIDDEHNPITDPLTQRSEHEWIITGYSLITEVAELLNVNFQSKGQYKTISGFIIIEPGRILSVGDQLVKFGYQFAVRKMDHLRVAEVKVSRIP